MTIRIAPPTATRGVVDSSGKMTQEFRTWTQLMTIQSIIIGSGSPESVIESQQASLYMDDTGSTGSILYIKQLDNIGGDKTQGWVLV